MSEGQLLTLHHPSIFQSLCEFIGDCLKADSSSEKYLVPKQSPSILHNDLKKDGA